MSKTPRIPGTNDAKEESLPEDVIEDTKDESLPEKPVDESKPCLTKGGWVVPTTKKG